VASFSSPSTPFATYRWRHRRTVSKLLFRSRTRRSKRSRSAAPIDIGSILFISADSQVCATLSPFEMGVSFARRSGGPFPRRLTELLQFSAPSPGDEQPDVDGGVARRHGQNRGGGEGCGYAASLGQRKRVAHIPTAEAARSGLILEGQRQARLHLKFNDPWSHEWGPVHRPPYSGEGGRRSPHLARLRSPKSKLSDYGRDQCRESPPFDAAPCRCVSFSWRSREEGSALSSAP
jgi:hypothetical protein